MSMNLKMLGLKRYCLPVSLIALGLGVLLARLNYLYQLPFLNGADAYYYALQVKYFALTGVLKIPDVSPLLYLMGFTGRLGVSPEMTVLLWSVLIQGLLVFNLVLARALVTEQKMNSLVNWGLVAWGLLSPTLTFTSIEFPKYAFALAFLPCWSVGYQKRQFWWVSIWGVLMAVFCHRALIGVAGLVIMGLLLQELLGCWRKNRFNYRLALGFILGSGVILSLLLLGRFFSWADLLRLRFENLQPSILTFMQRAGVPLALKLEVAVLSLIFIALIWFRARLQRRELLAFWSTVMIFLWLIPLGSQEIMGIPERLTLLLPIVVMIVLGGMTNLKLTGNKFWSRIVWGLIVAVLVVTLIFPKQHFRLAHPTELNPDYALYEKVVREIAPKKIPMLIAHLGLNYYYKFRTMKESFPYEPENHWPKEQIWRIAYGIMPVEYSYYLENDSLWDDQRLKLLPGRYSLIREDLWVQFRKRVAESRDEELKERVFKLWLNPSQKRPQFVRNKYHAEQDEPFSAVP